MTTDPHSRRPARRQRRLVIARWLVLVACVSCSAADPGYAGRSSKSWIGQLHQTDARAREEAADALGRVLAINPGQRDAVQALIGALSDTSDDVRVAAALALAKEGVHAEGAVPGLAAVARDSAHPFVRRIALETLGRITHSLPAHDAQAIATPIATALAGGLDDPDRTVRLTAVAALGGMRHAAAGAAPVIAPRLVALTRDVDPDLRTGALAALAALPAPTELVVATGVRMLSDSAARVRVRAAEVLGALRAQAAPATPALVRAVRDRDPDVRRAAVIALGDITPGDDPATTAALRLATRDPDAAVRQEAEHSLIHFHQQGGQDPPPPEPSLRARCANSPPGTPGC